MSTLNVSNISDGTDTVETGYVVNGSAKAWVNANGAGTVSIQESLNISSMFDVGVGVYSFTFSTSFQSTRHSTTASCAATAAGFDSFASLNPSPSAANQTLWCLDRTGGAEDQEVVSFHSIGDLA
jgi:hypothetical protein